MRVLLTWSGRGKVSGMGAAGRWFAETETGKSFTLGTPGSGLLIGERMA